VKINTIIPNPAIQLLLFLQSLVTILYLVRDSNPDTVTIGSIIAIGSATTVLFLLQNILIISGRFLLLLLSGRGPFSLLPSSVQTGLASIFLSLLTILLPLFLVFDDIHYRFMGFRLNHDQLILLIDGASSDMSPVSGYHLVIAIGGYLFWALLIHAGFNKSPHLPLRMKSLTGIIFAITVVFFLIIDTATGAIDQNGYKIKTRFIWNSYGNKKKTITNVPHQGFLGELFLEDSKILSATKKKYTDSTHALEHLKKSKNSSDILKPNILFLVVESLRRDMLSEEYMPKLYKRKNDWMVLENHFSSGANSGSGDFGLITGLSSFHFKNHKADKTVPFPFRVLKELGYELSIYFSNSMRYENIYDIFFEPVFDRTVNPEEKSQPEWDIELLDRYTRDIINQDISSPWFHFLRIYITHYGFYYPPDHEIYTPAASSDLGLSCGKLSHMKQQQSSIKNRYLNSVRFADTMIDDLLHVLESQGKFNDTIIVILGDHGEEFWEKGRFGHVFDLNREQIQTTALIRFPDMIRDRYKDKLSNRYGATSHSDIIPTIFDVMGLDFSVSEDIFDGRSLLSYNSKRDWITASTGLVRLKTPRKHIAVSNDKKVYFSTQNEKFSIEKITSLDDVLLDNFSRKEVRELLEKVQTSILH
jgi:glucan phosphoethanolaminetransferase (alkaline phosphatase superfamily)